MRIKLIAAVVASLFASGSAWGADDAFIWSGSIGVGARGANVDGENRNGAYGTSATTSAPFSGPKDEAKANEYRDLRNSAIGVIDVNGSSSNYYFRAFGENFGLDDQYINLRGGGWQVFKAQVFQDRIPHNLSWNALTPLNNPGGTLQTATGTYPPFQNPATWNSFDYGIQRNTTGGKIEFSNKTPWFIRAAYNEVETTGTRPGSAQLGTGSGNGLIEFGVPTDQKTKNTTIEAGYSTKQWGIKLGYLNSKFENSIDQMQWTNFYMRNALDTTLLTPGNELERWSLNGSWRDLPYDTAIVARITQSKLTNSVDVTAGGLKPVSNVAPPTGVGTLITTPSSSTFDGEHKTTSAAISLTSTPIKGLDGRLYYNYYDKDNNSTPISYAGGTLGSACATPPANSATCFAIGAEPAGELFGYRKNEYGLDLGWRFAPKQKLSGGYNYLKVDRDFEVAEETRDQKLWVEYKNSMVENLTGRVKYQYIERRSDINHSFTDSGTANPTQVQYYFSAYDVANYDQNHVRLELGWTPMPLLDISFGGTWRGTDYKDLYYGRTKDERTDLDITIGYGDPGKFRITAFGNWGEVKFDQAYRVVASATQPGGPGSPLPGGPQTQYTFDWGTKNTQDYYLLALQGDWVVNDRLLVTGSYSYQDTGGGVDFWSGNYAGTGGYNGGPLVNYVTDNTTTQRLNIKGEYKVNKNWSATLGYAYEQYDYADDQMRGYQGYYGYYQNLGGTNNVWMSGAFANPSYTNNIVYLFATYKFNY